jgi:hypothetical protein
MGSILGMLLGPGKGIMDGINDLVGKFVVDPTKKLEAQQQVLQLEAEYQKACMAADVSFAQAQAEVIKSESGSSNWLASSWRPILMLTFTFIVMFNYVLAPLFSLHSLTIVPDMWDLLKLGIGGYIAGRSLEKIAPSVATAISGK